MSDYEGVRAAGFVLDDSAGIGRTIFRRALGTGIAVDVDVSDWVGCSLQLWPTVAVESIIVWHHASEAPRTSDLALVDRIATRPLVAEHLRAFVTALDAVSDSRTGRVWIIETALRALDLIDLLDLEASDASENGIWPVGQTMTTAAARALMELPVPVQLSGGNRLRVAVGSISSQMQSRANKMTMQRLRNLVTSWPIPPEDTADSSDTAMTELAAAIAAYREGDVSKSTVSEQFAFRDTPRRVVDGSPVTLSLDLGDLIDIGLADQATRVVAARLGHGGDCAWEIRIPVRDSVARTYCALMDLWRPWQAQTLGEAIEPTGKIRSEFICAFGLLLAATHLPFALDDFLHAAALKYPPPPHLADVICLVYSGEIFGPLGMIEQPGQQGAVDLVTIIPYDRPPTLRSVSVAVRAERTPLVTGKKKTIAQRLLALRSDLATGRADEVPRRRSVKELEDLLDDRELVAAFRAEVAGAAPGRPALLSHDISALVEAIRQTEPQLALELRIAADQRDIDKVVRLAAHLTRTRAYLRAMSS